MFVKLCRYAAASQKKMTENTENFYWKSFGVLTEKSFECPLSTSSQAKKNKLCYNDCIPMKLLKGTSPSIAILTDTPEKERIEQERADK